MKVEKKRQKSKFINCHSGSPLMKHSNECINFYMEICASYFRNLDMIHSFTIRKLNMLKVFVRVYIQNAQTENKLKIILKNKLIHLENLVPALDDSDYDIAWMEEDHSEWMEEGIYALNELLSLFENNKLVL